MNGKRSRDENHESKGASKGKDCHEPPTTTRTKAFVFLPQSDVFAEGPPPPRELFVVRELCVGVGKHFPKRDVSAKSRQHKSAQKENEQEVLWHAIILRIPTTVENSLLPPIEVIAQEDLYTVPTTTFLKTGLDRPIFEERLSMVCPINRARYGFCRLAGVLSELFLANVRDVAVWTD